MKPSSLNEVFGNHFERFEGLEIRRNAIDDEYSIEITQKKLYMKNIVDKLSYFLENIDSINVFDALTEVKMSINTRIKFDSRPSIIDSWVKNILGIICNGCADFKIISINVLSKLCIVIPSLFSDDNLDDLVLLLREVLSSKDSILFEKSLVLLGNSISISFSHATRLFSLFPVLVSSCSEDLSLNSMQMFCIRSFTNKLAGSGVFDLKQLMILLSKHISIPEDESGKTSESTVYASWALSDLISANTPGTARALMETQVFLFMISLLSRSDHQVIIPALRTIGFVFDNLPNKNYFASDIFGEDFLRLLKNGITPISRETALCLKSIVESQTHIDGLEIETMLLRVFDLISERSFEDSQAYYSLLLALLEQSSQSDIEKLDMYSFLKKTLKFLQYENIVIAREVLQCLYQYYIKVSYSGQGGSFVEMFESLDGKQIVENLRELEDEEIHASLEVLIHEMSNESLSH